jgi:hypothetical protein
MNVWLLFKSKSTCDISCCTNNQGNKCFLTEKLKLTKEQMQQYEQIKVKHQSAAAQHTDSLHKSQHLLVQYMQQNNYDSIKLSQLEKDIQHYQTLLLQQSISQYYELKKILSNEQINILDSIYSGILVCRPSCDEAQHSSSHIHLH